MRCIRRRMGALLAVQGAALAGAANIWAGVAFDPTVSTVKITQEANINDPNDTPFVKSPTSIPVSSALFPVNGYQLNNHTFTFRRGGDVPVTSPTFTTGSLW